MGHNFVLSSVVVNGKKSGITNSATPLNTKAEPGSRRGRAAVAGGKKRVLHALALFSMLFVAYVANGYTGGNNDATANVHLATQILERGRWTFTPDDSPFMFVWRLRLPDRDIRARFHNWDDLILGQSARSLRESGALTFVQPKYYVVPTRQAGAYANTFGVGAGLLALPVVVAVKPFVGSLGDDPVLLWRIAKLVASVAAAGTAVFLFFAALLRLSLRASFVTALAFGLCTCVFSVSSQNLFQHGPAGLFLAMATFCLLKQTPASVMLAGAAYVGAVACRPTCVLALGVVAVWLAIGDRSSLVRFGLGAALPALLLGYYGWHMFGDPLIVGQSVVATQVAVTKTGNPGIWQTPFLVGAAGLLVSPSRGLLVYSPVVIVALLGIGRVWRDPSWRSLRPVSVAALVLFIPAAKRFDWWGGWSYGYRPILESVVLLAFLAIPMVAWVEAQRWRTVVASSLVLWSLSTQLIGAFAYDIRSWNGRRIYGVADAAGNLVTYDDRTSAQRHAREQGGNLVMRDLNVDRPENSYRLWSLDDNPLSFYLREWASVRAQRNEEATHFMREDG